MRADVVAVVEHDRAPLAQREHRLHVAHQCRAGERLELARVAEPQRGDLPHAEPGRDVAAAQIVRRGQIGHDVRDDAAVEQSFEHLGAVAT